MPGKKRKATRARSHTAGKSDGDSPKKNAAKRKPAKATSGQRSADRLSRAKRRASRKRPAGEPLPDIHCTLAPAGDTTVLLPTSTIAEITEYTPPEPFEGAPKWLLGQVEWEDWQVPVISYSALLDDVAPEAATAGSRIMVVKSLSSSARVPYIGVLVSQIPKLANVSETELEVNDEDDLPQGAHASVSIDGREAVVPDLDRLAQLVGHAAYGTADTTELPAAQA